MIKISILASTLLILLEADYTKAQTTTFDSLMIVAKNEQKKILLYFSGSDWCAPCIKFKKNFINQSIFEQFAKDSILLYNADFPRNKANQPGKEKTLENELLAEKYNPNGLFPFIILLGENGCKIKTWDGLPKTTVEDFIKEIRH